MPYTSDKRLYLNADRSKVVEEDSVDAAYLLVGEGGEVTDEDAKKYGLSASKSKASVAADEADTKQVAEPAENKAKTMRSDKSE